MRYDPRELEQLIQTGGEIHPRYGDLLRYDSVTLPAPARPDRPLVEFNPYMIHLSITARCNARCKGCINRSITGREQTLSFADTDPVRDAQGIARLVKDPQIKDVVVCFYGGEPLLRPGLIEHLMAELGPRLAGKNVRYMLYTNGQLIREVLETHPEIMQNLWLLSVSIDGTLRQHQQARRGTDLRAIETHLHELASRTPKPHVLMWSTLREEQSLLDCFNEFLRLYDAGAVNAFFWHWMETPEPFTDFKAYAQKYESELIDVIEEYLRQLQNGRVLPITHLHELLLYILTGRERGSTACGVELPGNYDIADGKIHACADLPFENQIGFLDENGRPQLRHKDLKHLTVYKNHLGCGRCGIGPYCGGRCPVQAQTSSALRLLQYCRLMRLHVATVMRFTDKIKSLMDFHHIGLQDLYDSSIIFNQFTDVTP